MNVIYCYFLPGVDDLFPVFELEAFFSEGCDRLRSFFESFRTLVLPRDNCELLGILEGGDLAAFADLPFALSSIAALSFFGFNASRSPVATAMN